MLRWVNVLCYCAIVLKLAAGIGFWFTIAKVTGCNVSLHCTVIWKYNIYNCYQPSAVSAVFASLFFFQVICTCYNNSCKRVDLYRGS